MKSMKYEWWSHDMFIIMFMKIKMMNNTLHAGQDDL